MTYEFFIVKNKIGIKYFLEGRNYMKKAAFFDVDGTLIDCTIGIMDISDRVKKSYKRFSESWKRGICI